MNMKKLMTLACATLALFTAGTSLAETYYWDSNTNSAGFGTAQGAWAAPTIPSGTQGWTTNSAGSTALNSVTTANSDALNFGNGATGLGGGTITISGTVDSGDMTFASGSGAIVLSVGRINLAPAVTITLNNAADTISGVLDGAATSLTKQGTGTLTLSYNANQFTGPTVISAGKITLGAQYALWKSAYDTTGSTGAIGLDVTGQVAPVLGGLAGNVDLMTGVTAYNAVTALTLNPQTGYTNTYSGVIANGSGAMTLTKTGDGAQTLTGVNSYSGATTIYDGTLGLGGAAGSALNSAFTVRGGTLSLDNSAGWTNRLADGTALSLGSLILTSSNGAGITNETVGATTFATSGKVTVNNGSTAGDQTTLALGNVTRSAGAAIDFAGTGLGSLGGGADSPNVTSTGTWPGAINGILPWATVNGTQWAENNANSIRAYSSTFVDPTSAGTDATKNAQLTGSGTMGSAKSFNSLNVIASGAGQSMSLGGILTLTSPGAILKSGTDAYSITSSVANAITDGTELIAHVDGGDLTVSAPLNTAIVGLAKGGTGKLILSGTRAGTFSGAMSIVGNLEFQGAGTTLSGAISGPGGLVANLNSGQRLILSSGANTYSGPTLVKGGILQIGTAHGNQGGQIGGVPGSSMASAGQGLLSNIELNGGSLAVWYYMSEFLGSGPGQIQLTGGRSGISAYQTDMGSSTWTINSDANYEVVWGSAYFNPSVFVLQDSSITGNGGNVAGIPNKIDLNGATRTVASDSNPFATPYSAGYHNGGRLGGVIRDSQNSGAGLIKTGIGHFELAGANTFNGPVTIEQGTLWITSVANGGVASALGMSSAAASNVLLANGSTLRYSGGAASSDRSFTLNGTAAGHSATLDASGSGAINLTSTATPGYGTSGQTRTLILGGTYAGLNTLAATLADNSGAAVSVTKTGAGLWVLSGANAYTGPTTLSAGTLSVSAANNLGNGAANLVFNGGTLQVTGTGLTTLSGLGRTIIANPGVSVGLDIATAANTFTVDQAISGSVSVVKSGAGTLVFSTNNTYSGVTTISSGVLQYNDGSTIPTTPLYNSGALVINRTDTITQGSTFHSIMMGTGSLTNIGAGTLALNNINLYSGNTKANAGTIALSHPLALWNSAIDTTGSGVFTLSGVTAPTIGGLTQSGAPRDLASVFTTGYSSVTNLTLNPSGTVTYGGVIGNGASGMALTMAGTGTQVLTNSNTYTGATILKAGTLQLSGNGALTSSPLAPTGGNLLLVNTTAGEAALNRISDSAAITANGGTITFQNTSGTTTYSETIGAVTLASGQLNIVQAVNQTGAGSQTLTLGGLGRSGSGMVTFSATTTAPNATKNMIKVTGASGAGAGQNLPGGVIIGPWATAGTEAYAQTDYAVYNASGYVLPANITASDETTWTNSANAYTSSTGGALTLGATAHNMLGLRNTGATTVMTIQSGGNLNTYGLLNGVSTLLTVAATGTGALSTPAGGGNLYVTTGSGAITISAPINNNGSDVVTLVAGGAGTLALSGANTYSGGTVVNGGRLVADSDVNLGNSGGGLTFNGTSTFGASGSWNIGSGRTITVSAGANVTFDTASGVFAGPVTGSGTFNVTKQAQGAPNLSLTNTGNTFTGAMNLGTKNVNSAYTFNSIGDGPGAGIITLTPLANFYWGSGAVSPLVLNYRQFDIFGGSINNDNASSSNTITINTDLLSTATDARTLTLGGSNTGNNTFAGRIADGSAAVISLSKAGSGTWILSNTNTYSGATTISGGILSINSIANVGGGVSALGMPMTVANGTIAITGTLQYTGSGHTSDRVINLSGTTGGATLDASGTGALVLTTNLTATGAGAKTLTLTGTSTNLNTLSGAIVDSTSATALAKAGIGTWKLSGANTNTGASTVSGGGTLILDYATQDNSKLSDGASLTLSGGTLTLKDGSHTEVVLSTTLNTAGTFLTRSGSSTGKLRLNAIGRAVGGTISFADATIADTDTANAAGTGILGGWATLGNDWAINSTAGLDAPITALSSYTGTLPSTLSAVTTANYTLTGSQSQSGAVSANTVKIANSGNSQTLTLGANNLTITTLGGLLYVGGNDSNYTISGTGIVGTPAGELIITTVSGTTLNMSAPIIGSGAGILTKTGVGTLVLNAASLYTGATYVNQGTLRLANATATGTTGGGIFVQNGAAVEFANGITVGAEAITVLGTGVASGGALSNYSGTNTYAGAITVGTGGALIKSVSGLLTLGGAITTSLGNDLIFDGTGDVTVTNVISGAGRVIKNGTGTLTLTTNNTYSGATLINEGTLVGVVGGSCSNSAVTVASAGALGVRVTDNSKKWTCASLALNNGSQLKFNFTGTPSTSTAPLNILGSLTFSGTPTIVVSPINTAPGTYPLLTVGGVAPTALPTLSGVTGKLFWGGAGNKTLYVTIIPAGTVILFR